MTSGPTTSSAPFAPPLVAICRRLPGEIDLGPGASRQNSEERALTRPELLEFVRGASVLITWVSEKVNAEVLEAAGPNLRGVCNFAVGTDNIDLAACKAKGVIVTNTPDAVTEGTADIAWALLLAVARRVVEGDRFARSPEYAARGPLGPSEFLGVHLTGRTLAIVGAGRIGYATALRSIGWGMRVLYVARSRHWNFELAPLAARRVTLEEALREADVVSLHTPLTPETRGLINADKLALMKPDAILLNTARGPIVDESALAAHLKARRIYGAGLDVFEREPVVHPDLLGLDNCVLTPHVGSGAAKYRALMTEMACANARAILEGREPPNRVV
ncbi:MAG: D-glycerate dehydrogenase [Planctomycetota bacterium]|nr:D-glycerate dehydrogenase [Planctomycetota bacterium]